MTSTEIGMTFWLQRYCNAATAVSANDAKMFAAAIGEEVRGDASRTAWHSASTARLLYMYTCLLHASGSQWALTVTV